MTVSDFVAYCNKYGDDKVERYMITDEIWTSAVGIKVMLHTPKSLLAVDSDEELPLEHVIEITLHPEPSAPFLIGLRADNVPFVLIRDSAIG